MLLSEKRSSKTLSGKLPNFGVICMCASALDSQEKLLLYKTLRKFGQFFLLSLYIDIHMCHLCVVPTTYRSRITRLCILAPGLGFKGKLHEPVFVYTEFIFALRWQGVRGPFSIQCNQWGINKSARIQGSFSFTPHVCTINLLLKSSAGLHIQLITEASNNKLLIVGCCD